MIVGEKTWGQRAEAAGSEMNLYLERLSLIDKPYKDWTPEDQNLALVCGFAWMQWMQLIRTGKDRVAENRV